jgi:hypothetical protein
MFVAVWMLPLSGAKTAMTSKTRFKKSAKEGNILNGMDGVRLRDSGLSIEVPAKLQTR